MSTHVELRHPEDMADGKRYQVVLVDDVFPDGLQLGTVESFRDTVQQMHRAAGFQSIARKTTHPKRWRARAGGQRPSHGYETRWEAIANLLRAQDPALHGTQSIAKTAKVIR